MPSDLVDGEGRAEDAILELGEGGFGTPRASDDSDGSWGHERLLGGRESRQAWVAMVRQQTMVPLGHCQAATQGRGLNSLMGTRCGSRIR